MAKVINPKDYIGKKYGRLTVFEHIGFIYPKNTARYFKCNCECGGEKLVALSHLKKGSVTSCGCYAAEKFLSRITKHGKWKTSEFSSWTHMIYRCYNKNSKAYKNYGGRGIVVCERWRSSFENFLSDMGEKPSPKHSIERDDVNGNYEPSNCKWVTMFEQAANKRTNVFYEINGVVKHGAGWGAEWGMKKNAQQKLKLMEKKGLAKRVRV